ncbi:hypothetical protein SAMN04488074_1442 [Lentzea albidocapillata subsp. violacea]|uniref:Uncharacterized protein n=1 Tax=Lentzea albidocapillata subsp. violacea TaxID=128104 RepID=A0A1H0A678_9PSEU|nr:hypothetical protein [Lentzea albidocapillata]SDN29040.1 hypothetical protein SAMN04488074_1442 [Lentzea albidocapillata subsp. violacea]
MRLSLTLVCAGVLGSVAILATTASAQSVGTASDDPAGQPSLVEDFEHPNKEAAAAIGMTLKKGNGRIFWVDCAVGGDLLTVESDSITTPNHIACFRVTGRDGYLALEIPSTYFVKAGKFKINAVLTAQVDGQEVKREYTIKPGELTSVGEIIHPEEGVAALVELRSVS